ncbi:MAG: DDE-type integrase/transposase/recombinase [Myxococcota bacterium]
MVQLRFRRKAGWEIARELDVPVSTVSKHLKREGVGRIWRLEEEQAPPRRYEHGAPGDLLHIDAKKLARINGVGHRIHGDRRRKNRGIGYEVVFVCVDDYSRLAYAEVHPAEDARSATRFLKRAVAWFRSLGIEPRRILSDNAKCYVSKPFTALCDREGCVKLHEALHAPDQRQGGTLHPDDEAPLGLPVRVRTSAMRAESLRPWVKHYNHERPHRSLGKRTPMQRLREYRQQAA